MAALNKILESIAAHFELDYQEVVKVAMECPAFNKPRTQKSSQGTKGGFKKVTIEAKALSEYGTEDIEEIEKISAKDLKALCKEAGLKVGGKKQELVERFQNYLRGDVDSGRPQSPRFEKKSDEPIELCPETTEEELEKITAKTLKQMCKDHGLPVGGKKQELIARLLEKAHASDDSDAEDESDTEEELTCIADCTCEDELDQFNVKDYKEYLKEQGLRVTGKKDELKARVWRALNEESTDEDRPKKAGRSPKAVDAESDAESDDE